MKLLNTIPNHHSKPIKLSAVFSICLSLLITGAHHGPAFSQPSSPKPHASAYDKHQTKAEEPQVAGLRTVYVYEATTAGASYVRKVFLLLDDGTFTRDFETLAAGLSTPANGGNIARSRRENPRQWGEWRIDPENDFMYKFSYQSEWRDHASTPSAAVTPDRRLEGCYTAQSTINAARSFGTFCFTENGYFLERGSNATERARGIYSIQEPFLVTKDENENVVVSYIGVYGSGEEISINEAVFTQQSRE